MREPTHIMIKNSIDHLLYWIEENQYESYDHFDFWSSKIGINSRSIFVRNKFFGLPLVAPLYLLDMYFPHLRRFFAKKSRSAEAIPRIATSYFKLYQLTGEECYLEKGYTLLDWLRKSATKTNNGIGWGLHFDWQKDILLPKGTPCVTITAYSVEAFLLGYKLSGNNEFLEIAMKASEFVANDLNYREGAEMCSLSYTPMDQHYVINANSYGALILNEVIQYRFDAQKKKIIDKLINYLLSQQNIDGSWYYYDKYDVPDNKNFIDCFHSCFIIENLFLILKTTGDIPLKSALDKGYNFFINNFINDDDSIYLYNKYPFYHGINVDMRGCAESIHCLAVLSEEYPDALELAVKIANWSINHMQDKEGYFYFRKYRTHTHKMPYIRWCQAPMLNALTKLFYCLTERNSLDNTKGQLTND